MASGRTNLPNLLWIIATLLAVHGIARRAEAGSKQRVVVADDRSSRNAHPCGPRGPRVRARVRPRGRDGGDVDERAAVVDFAAEVPKVARSLRPSVAREPQQREDKRLFAHIQIASSTLRYLLASLLACTLLASSVITA